MANIKESLTRGITALNVKTNSFMEESKCKTYISTLEGEIKELKLQIGEKIYEKWSHEESYEEDIQVLLAKIKEKYAEIDVQKEKMIQLSEEQKQILGTPNTANQPVQAAEEVFCSQCGAKNPENYKFCSKCGAQLK
jgi:hypothetical protein